MTTLWENIKKTAADGISFAAEKTEDFSKYSKAKIDVFTLKRRIAKQLAELGGIAYQATKEGQQDNFFEMPEVKVLIDSIKEGEVDLNQREIIDQKN